MADEKPTQRRRRRVQAYAPGTTCEIEGCEKPVTARGWCGMHYYRWKQHGDPNRTVRYYAPGTCELPGCERPAPGCRYCSTHRARLTRLGSFDLAPRDRHSHSMGYQIIKRPGHPLAQTAGWVYEHRVVLYDAIGPGWHPCHRCGMPVSWELTYPEYPEALVVDHLDEDRTNNDPSNLAPCCQVCNLQRSSRWVKRQRGASA